MNVACRSAAIALTVLLLAPAGAEAQTVERTLSVLGSGQVELQPDRGSFSAGVTRLSSSANTARSRTNARIKAIVAGLRGVGVGRDEITTSEISIRREQQRDGKDGPVRVRFRASVGLRVAIDGLARLARAIDVTSKRGATAVFGPRLAFSAERQAAGRLQSEAAALDDARTRAEAAAAAEGQEIVGVQSIDLDPSLNQFTSFAVSDESTAAAGSSPSRTQVFAAKRKVTAQALVTYLIAPAAAR